MNSIIISALFASGLIGVSTANPACGLAPLLPQIYGANDAACETACLGCLEDATCDLCPANACTVTTTVLTAGAAAAAQGKSLDDLINLVNMAMAAQGVSPLPANIVEAAMADPTGAGAQARDVLLKFGALLDDECQ